MGGNTNPTIRSLSLTSFPIASESRFLCPGATPFADIVMEPSTNKPHLLRDLDRWLLRWGRYDIAGHRGLLQDLGFQIYLASLMSLEEELPVIRVGGYLSAL
jgi:hypothetical protein